MNTETRIEYSAALRERLEKVESRECTCGMNRCARCDESAWLRSVLGLPPEQDESIT